MEHPPVGGPQLRIENTIKALSRVGNLYIVSRVNQAPMGGSAAERFYSGFAKAFHYAPSCLSYNRNRYFRKARNILGELTGYDAARDCAFILHCVDEWKIDVVWLGYGNSFFSFPLIKALRRARPALKLVCDTDSVWSRFVLRELPYIKNPLRQILVARRGRAKEREERAWVVLCDVTTGVSEVDCAYYRSLAADTGKIHQFSNVIDLESYAALPPPAPGLKHPCIYLAGQFGHATSAMNRAARWMLDDVLPIVRRTLPDIHFYIVGNRSKEAFGQEESPHVTVTGRLDSVLPYLAHADLSVVPLQFESGTRFKILEAAACRIPIVSTTLGAEGLPVQHEKHLLLADTPEAFAAAIIRLIGDRPYAAALADACRQMVHGHFSVDSLEKEARKILDYILK